MVINILLYAAVIALNVIANVFLKIAAQNLPAFGSAPFFEILKAVANRWFIIGLLGFVFAFPAFVMLLNRQKLSVASPIVMAAVFLCVALASIIWLKESLSAMQLAGIFVIVAGVALLSQS